MKNRWAFRLAACLVLAALVAPPASIEAVGKPDLAIAESDISVNPSSPKPGEKTTIAVNVHNFGTLDAVAVRVRFNDTFLPIGEKVIDIVPANGTKEASIDWTPAWAGPHIIRITVNPDHTIPEEDYSNNEASRNVTVGLGGGELKVEAELSPSTAAPYEVVWTNGTVKSGGIPVSNATVTVTVTGTAISTSTVTRPEGTFSASLAPPNATGTYAVEISAKFGLLTGNASRPLRVVLPDLVITAVSWPATAKKDDTVKLSATVKNNGTAPASNISVRFRLDGMVPPDASIASLTPGNSSTVSVTWKAKVGRFTVKVTVDPAEKILEENRTNNVREGRIEVKDSSPVPGFGAAALLAAGAALSVVFRWRYGAKGKGTGR